MSIFSDIKTLFDDVLSLIFPPRCIICGGEVESEGQEMCFACSQRIPMTGFTETKENPVWSLFAGYIPIEDAASLYWFIENSEWRKVVHRFKYSGQWLLAKKMGGWLGRELRHSENFNDIDLVIPIPLHPFKRMWRSYNQSEYIALGVAQAMDISCDANSVRRFRYNESQTRKRRGERWENVAGIFSVAHPERLRGRHILLVDDVLTTGATILSCAEAIIKACEGDVRISVATLAVSQRTFRK